MSGRNRLAQRVVANAVMHGMAQKQGRRRGAPLGMGGSGLSFAMNSNGTRSVNAVSLEAIPSHRAVKVGPHPFDARTIVELFEHSRDGQPRNPLTREVIPMAAVKEAHRRLGRKFSTEANYWDERERQQRRNVEETLAYRAQLRNRRNRSRMQRLRRARDSVVPERTTRLMNERMMGGVSVEAPWTRMSVPRMMARSMSARMMTPGTPPVSPSTSISNARRNPRRPL